MFLVAGQSELFAVFVARREAVAAKHKEMNLNPRELLHRLQIKAELGNYVPVSGGRPS
jgi:hypothetical protein